MMMVPEIYPGVDPLVGGLALTRFGRSQICRGMVACSLADPLDTRGHAVVSVDLFFTLFLVMIMLVARHRLIRKRSHVAVVDLGLRLHASSHGSGYGSGRETLPGRGERMASGRCRLSEFETALFPQLCDRADRWSEA